MKIYLVQEFSRADYDFSTDIKNHGLYVNRDEAVVRARQIFEKLKEQHITEDEDDDCFDEDVEVEFDIDEDKGWFEFSFGCEEDFELFRVTVEEIEFNNEAYVVHNKCKRQFLIEDIQNKAWEMDIDLTDKDIESIADRVNSGLDKNDSLWESYWLTIEYVLEEL